MYFGNCRRKGRIVIIGCIGKETEVHLVARFSCCWNIVGCGSTCSELLVFKSSFDCSGILLWYSTTVASQIRA